MSPGFPFATSPVSVERFFDLLIVDRHGQQHEAHGDDGLQHKELCAPFQPLAVGHADHADGDDHQAAGGIEQIREAVRKAEGDDHGLARQPQQVAEDRHQRHHKEGLCRAGADKEFQHRDEQEHQQNHAVGRKTLHRAAQRVEDGVHDHALVQHVGDGEDEHDQRHHGEDRFDPFAEGGKQPFAAQPRRVAGEQTAEREKDAHAAHGAVAADGVQNGVFVFRSDETHHEGEHCARQHAAQGDEKHPRRLGNAFVFQRFAAVLQRIAFSQGGIRFKGGGFLRILLDLFRVKNQEARQRSIDDGKDDQTQPQTGKHLQPRQLLDGDDVERVEGRGREAEGHGDKAHAHAQQGIPPHGKGDGDRNGNERQALLQNTGGGAQKHTGKGHHGDQQISPGGKTVHNGGHQIAQYADLVEDQEGAADEDQDQDDGEARDRVVAAESQHGRHDDLPDGDPVVRVFRVGARYDGAVFIQRELAARQDLGQRPGHGQDEHQQQRNAEKRFFVELQTFLFLRLRLFQCVLFHRFSPLSRFFE